MQCVCLQQSVAFSQVPVSEVCLNVSAFGCFTSHILNIRTAALLPLGVNTTDRVVCTVCYCEGLQREESVRLQPGSREVQLSQAVLIRQQDVHMLYLRVH